MRMILIDLKKIYFYFILFYYFIIFNKNKTKQNKKTKDDYWKGVNPDINGMLGGFGHISDVDIQGSKDFLADLETRKPSFKLQLGRVLGKIKKKLKNK